MKRLKILMDEYEESQKELARYLDVKPSSVSHWVTGRYNPTVDTLLKIAERYGVSTDYLLGHSDSRAFGEPDGIRLLREYLSTKNDIEYSTGELSSLDDIITRILRFRE